jgi:hypothetical protein
VVEISVFLQFSCHREDDEISYKITGGYKDFADCEKKWDEKYFWIKL